MIQGEQLYYMGTSPEGDKVYMPSSSIDFIRVNKELIIIDTTGGASVFFSIEDASSELIKLIEFYQ
jgi:hypothetical protein